MAIYLSSFIWWLPFSLFYESLARLSCRPLGYDIPIDPHLRPSLLVLWIFCSSCSNFFKCATDNLKIILISPSNAAFFMYVRVKVNWQNEFPVWIVFLLRSSLQSLHYPIRLWNRGLGQVVPTENRNLWHVIWGVMDGGTPDSPDLHSDTPDLVDRWFNSQSGEDGVGG